MKLATEYDLLEQEIINAIIKVEENINPVPIEEFFAKGFPLTSDDRFSHFKLELSPWYRIFFKWFEDSETEWIHLIQASQSSKTTFMMGVLLYISKHIYPSAPCLWAFSIEDEANTFVKERLRPFLDDSGDLKRKSWKNSAFRVGNALVKIGHASTKQTLRTMPCRFVFGDECGLWKEAISYLKKRTRTYIGKRKGIFCTTPPEDGTNDAWQEAISGGFYQWHVPCPPCGEYQYLSFKNLRWDGKNEKTGDWDYNDVRLSCKYVCPKCQKSWDESKKPDILNLGKAVRVNPITYEVIPDSPTDSKALQISSLYSPFIKWGKIAEDFLKAKKTGKKALKVFITDELAEVPQETGESVQVHLEELKDYTRQAGFVGGYSVYTMGVDLQTKGELYYTLLGWKTGQVPSCHVLKYGVLLWKNQSGSSNFDAFLAMLAPFKHSLYQVALDASFGPDSSFVYDFCDKNGSPFFPLKEVPTLAMPVRYSDIQIDPWTKKRLAFGRRLMEVNSHQIKDEIAATFQISKGEPGAWTFPGDCSEEYFQHIRNEHRVFEKRGNRTYSVWKEKFSHAPQHYFSSLVYAFAAAQDIKYSLYQIAPKKEKVVEEKHQESSWISKKDW